MPDFTEAADAIRILVATDNHVGYGERDATRKDDSWKSFDEIMRLAKHRDVDMVLLAGDLFHDNNPSRQSMYQVMRSLRLNCLGEKPCELEMLNDKTDVFEGAFDHVNYEDPDINVAIPVFSIHGNHDDPTGIGHLASLDILQMGGLVNYYGRTHESDNIEVKPVLLQKGSTKLALYGMSNVRDERLFRTFRDGKVKFFRPGAQEADWFNIISVHQNHHAYTETGYLKEELLPDFMDLVVWGHEHECLIEPRQNPETGFHVMQPGSSVATSLVAGEAVPKHVSVVTVTGREFTTESIRLKTVRPFLYKEIALAEDPITKKLARRENNRAEVTRRLEAVVTDLIKQAKQDWVALQGESEEEVDVPLPLIRLRVDYSTPDGGSFDCENPQRFSNRFQSKVANVNDVVQFHRKKTAASRRPVAGIELPEESAAASTTLDTVKVEKLVREFLAAQNLTILPQMNFGDAVAQFVDKDDKHAMEMFVADTLKSQVQHLLKLDDDDDMDEALEENRTRLEELFSKGQYKPKKKAKLRPKPANWDSDLNGNWSDEPAALIHPGSDVEDEDDDDASRASVPPPMRGRGRGRDRGGTTSTRKSAASAKKTTPAKTARSRKKQAEEESDDEDVEMLDNMENSEDESQSQLFVQDTPPPTRSRKAAAPKRGAQQKLTQTTLNATRSQASARTGAQGGAGLSRGTSRQASIAVESGDDDEDDAFEPVPAKGRAKK